MSKPNILLTKEDRLGVEGDTNAYSTDVAVSYQRLTGHSESGLNERVPSMKVRGRLQKGAHVHLGTFKVRMRAGDACTRALHTDKYDSSM